MRPLCRSHVPLVMQCERCERTNAATSSLSVQSSPPSPTESTLLEKKLNAPARPQVPSLRPCEGGARRVRDILDQRDAVAVADLLHAVRGGCVAGVVDDADGLRARRDATLDILRVEARVLARDDLGEDRVGAAVDRRRGRRRERERRHDHLVPRTDPGGEVGEVQRRRAARDRDRVPRAEVRGERRARTLPCAGRASASPSAASRQPLPGPAAAAAGRRAGAPGRSRCERHP